MAKKRGFTLIEAVIVLAIGALVILVVLQAVNSARRSQRDNTRKAHAAAISAALEQYASNNGQTYPTEANFTAFQDAYKPVESAGTAVIYDDVASCPVTVGADSREVQYVRGATGRDYSLSVCLEVGGASPIQ